MTEKENKKQILKKLLSYVEPQHLNNLHIESITDIFNILIEFCYGSSQNINWVCNATMGAGKSTSLICFLKYILELPITEKIPLLLVIDELGVAQEIYEEIRQFAYTEKIQNAIIQIDSYNLNTLQDDITYYQIAIITHKRLSDLAINHGDIDVFRKWTYRNKEKQYSYKTLKRKVICDERPIFISSEVFDIADENNCIDWYRELTSNLDIDSAMSQYYKFLLMLLFAKQTVENKTDTTVKMLNNSISDYDKNNILDLINKIDKNINNKATKAYHRYYFFKKLLTNDGIGKIDEVSFNSNGRKVLCSEFIDYSSIGMDLLIFDGTANETDYYYKQEKCQFIYKSVKNYNNYNRLYLHHESINTSKRNRNKKDNQIQEAIASRFVDLKSKYPNIFMLPDIDDKDIYCNMSDVLISKNIEILQQKTTDKSKTLHLFNTVGKNQLLNYRQLYLPSLPRANAEYYKLIAIALYGTSNINISFNQGDSNSWFEDDKVENIYKKELISEILQIIHRCALRKIKSNERIDVFIAFDDLVANNRKMSKIFYLLQTYLHNSQDNYFFDVVPNIKSHKMHEKIKEFVDKLEEITKNDIQFQYFIKKIPLANLGKEGVKFNKFILNNKNKKREIFKELGKYNVFIEEYPKGKYTHRIICKVDARYLETKEEIKDFYNKQQLKCS